jgi:AraC-like DNA-binding protein
MNAGGRTADYAVWTRVGGARGDLDLLAARFSCQHYAPHTHEEFAVGVCVDGVESIRYRGDVHYAGPGSVVVLEPGETHTGGPAAASGFAYRCMYPPAHLFAEREAGQPHFRDPVIADPQLARAFLAAHDALACGDPLEGESRLVCALGTLVCRHGMTSRVPGAAASQRVVRAIMTRLEDQMVCPPTLAEMAADVGLSRYHLVRAFGAAAGMPPYAWLAQHRVSKARCLLDAGYRPAEVAGLVGFADQAHLTRWFRRVLGVTPGAYRNSVQDSRAAVTETYVTAAPATG